MKGRPTPSPPYPELQRRPRGAFGWLEAELLHDGWLADLGPHATATLLLLALAADRRGASFFSRDKMALALDISRHELDHALQSLLEAGLVAHRPWRVGARDGVWQLLPHTPRRQPERSQQSLSAAQLLRGLGLVDRKE